ncbi:MAG: HNH endonuclease [Candidatus Aminicenantes bacterium]|nr:HNH endonuclease [Candidatus Aminicenantes bacterium]
MPHAAPHPCSYPGCKVLVETRDGRCEDHQIQVQREADERGRRGSAANRGYGSKWRVARKEYLRRNPLCVECHGERILKAATVVDHIIPHKGDSGLFWDESNWQALIMNLMTSVVPIEFKVLNPSYRGKNAPFVPYTQPKFTIKKNDLKFRLMNLGDREKIREVGTASFLGGPNRQMHRIKNFPIQPFVPL